MSAHSIHSPSAGSPHPLSRKEKISFSSKIIKVALAIIGTIASYAFLPPVGATIVSSIIILATLLSFFKFRSDNTSPPSSTASSPVIVRVPWHTRLKNNYIIPMSWFFRRRRIPIRAEGVTTPTPVRRRAVVRNTTSSSSPRVPTRTDGVSPATRDSGILPSREDLERMGSPSLDEWRAMGKPTFTEWQSRNLPPARPVVRTTNSDSGERLPTRTDGATIPSSVGNHGIRLSREDWERMGSPTPEDWQKMGRPSSFAEWQSRNSTSGRPVVRQTTSDSGQRLPTRTDKATMPQTRIVDCGDQILEPHPNPDTIQAIPGRKKTRIDYTSSAAHTFARGATTRTTRNLSNTNPSSASPAPSAPSTSVRMNNSQTGARAKSR